MYRLPLIAIVLVGAALSACAPHPIVARDPVPAPTGAERFSCDATYLPLNGVFTDCEEQGRRSYEERAVIRSKG